MQNCELIFPKINQAFLFHQAQLVGKGAAVNAEEGGHLLTGERDGEAFCLPFAGLHGQISHDSIPQTLLRENSKAIFFLHIEIGNQGEQAVKDLTAGAVGEDAGIQEEGGGKIEKGAILRSHGMIGRNAGFGANEVGTENLALGQRVHNAAASIGENVKSMDLAL